MTDLRVTSAHVRELAARQAAAAAQIQQAAAAAEGTTASMAVTHGFVCAPAILAVQAAEAARSAACAAMAAVSTDLNENLTTAATVYDDVDAQSGQNLSGEMHPR
jgi:hypothetical protein